MDLIAPSLNIQTGANAAHDTMNDSIMDGKISSGFFDHVVSGEKLVNCKCRALHDLK